jgi:hypothetical protein
MGVYFHMSDPDGHELSFCVSDLAVFQQLHELILIEEKFVKILTQHCWAQVVVGMGFPE